MSKIKHWWLWEFLKSGIFVAFLLFFGFFATIAFISEKKKNNSKVQVMKENVIYIRPVGFVEKQPNDSTNLEIE